MKIAGLLVFITDVHSIGIKNAAGLLATEAWYWDLNDETRAFAGRFIQKMKRMPTMVQAGDYSSMLTYLKAVKAAGTDNPDQVMAMFNLEMIGTESKWGKNSAYITGYEKSSMGEILKKNLAGSEFTFYPDPYLDQNLFYRSDNATLAELGVPAHTISTSKMDSEPNYHKASDEVQTLDLDNMTEIIKAIATSATSIISGKDTPSRVDTTKLK
jgi:Zn-dependent M28 family amino/carboxypeptidase